MMDNGDCENLKRQALPCEKCGEAPKKYQMRHGGNKANVRDETMRVCFGCRLLLLGQGFDSQGSCWHLEGFAPNLWARNEWANEDLRIAEAVLDSMAETMVAVEAEERKER
jgi:hypothetical protein